MDIYTDERVVLTLDAGGTNFVFGAMRSGKEIADPVILPPDHNDLELGLKKIIEGFRKVMSGLKEKPVAISFAFPGPADYEKGIIGDLQNLPTFRGGVALADMLKDHFEIPVFIANDGDLFAYGEAIGGFLYDINARLRESNNPRICRNLVGLTLGTGFGAGLVFDGTLLKGDNSIPAEIWNTPNSISPERNAEEGVSARAIVREYLEQSGASPEEWTPLDVYQIAHGEKAGSKEAALHAFRCFGQHLGDSIANLIMLFDAQVVIGGGLTGAADLYMPAVMEVLSGTFSSGQSRLVQEVYNLDHPDQMTEFLQRSEVKVKVPFSKREVVYQSASKVAIGTSKLGASRAISLGAYANALGSLG